MQAIRLALGVGLMLGLAACSAGSPVARGTKTAPMGLAAPEQTPAALPVQAPIYAVREVRVTVPRDLKVSEANTYYPLADIVWRGEPTGDRYAQVQAILTEAVGFGTADMRKGRDVIVEVEVRRFHCLTEKTRYTVGGVHSMRFELTVRDAGTGTVLDGPRLVIADLPASGGKRALSEERAGRTQRVVITEHLSQVIRRELSGGAAAPQEPTVTVPQVNAALPEAPVSQGSSRPAAAPVTGEALLQSVQMSL